MGASGILMSAMWLQETDAISSGNAKLLMIFIGLVALAMLVQAAVVLALGLGVLKAQKKVMGIADELKVKAMPLIAKAEALYAELEPKVRTITNNVTETTTMVKNKVHDFEATLDGANHTIKATLAQLDETVKAANATALDVNARARAQVAHVDHMVTDVLTKTAEVSASVQRGMAAPGRAISNMANGIRGGFQSMAHGVRGGFESLLERKRSASATDPIYRKPRPVSTMPVNARPVSTMRDMSPSGAVRDVKLSE